MFRNVLASLPYLGAVLYKTDATTATNKETNSLHAISKNPHVSKCTHLGRALLSKTDTTIAIKGIGDAGSIADLRMLWSAIFCLGLL